MRGLLRNKRKFWYCLYKDTNIPGSAAFAGDAVSGVSVVGDDEFEGNPMHDENGYETGETIARYAEPVQMKAMITSATGQIRTEPFGTYEDYDRIIVTAWTDCPIDENTVLFVDKEPEYTDIPDYEVEESETLFGNDTITPVTYRQPMYDYRVVRVSRGINGARIFIHKAATT